MLAIATVAAIGVGGELLLDAGLAFSCFGLAVVLGRHLYLLHRLTAHLEHGRQLTPPPAGPWGAVFGAVLRLERKSRKWRRRFHRFQDRFIESAEAFPDAAVVLDKRGRIEWCNPASGALLGLQWPDVARRDFLETVRDPLLGDYIAAGRYHHPLHLPSPSQQAKVLSVRITPYRNKRKKLLIARDITRSFYLDRM
ncbi:MAG: DUF3329 domain-containing protein, partial [Gammaproteobacteria bacterium]|nr:DUF3329 domain-containing protein [Gammaproteobacteria bacterium]